MHLKVCKNCGQVCRVETRHSKVCDPCKDKRHSIWTKKVRAHWEGRPLK